jgi:hypothetical protein
MTASGACSNQVHFASVDLSDGRIQTVTYRALFDALFASPKFEYETLVELVVTEFRTSFTPVARHRAHLGRGSAHVDGSAGGRRGGDRGPLEE